MRSNKKRKVDAKARRSQDRPCRNGCGTLINADSARAVAAHERRCSQRPQFTVKRGHNQAESLQSQETLSHPHTPSLTPATISRASSPGSLMMLLSPPPSQGPPTQQEPDLELPHYDDVVPPKSTLPITGPQPEVAVENLHSVEIRPNPAPNLEAQRQAAGAVELEDVPITGQHRLPDAFYDHIDAEIPETEAALVGDLTGNAIADLETQPETDDSNSELNSQVNTRGFLDTVANSFGLFQRFLGSRARFSVDDGNKPDQPQTPSQLPFTPSANNDSGFLLSDSDEESAPVATVHQPADTETPTLSFIPFRNASIFRLIKWWYSSPLKSEKDLQSLIDNVISAPDFSPADLVGVKAARELERLNAPLPSNSDSSVEHLPSEGQLEAKSIDDILSSAAGWHHSSVTLQMPCAKRTYWKESLVPTVEIPGIYHRNLLDGLTQFFQGPKLSEYTLHGHQLWWKPSENEEPERVYGEVVNSETFLEMEREVHAKFPKLSNEDIKNDVKEIIVAPIMLYSDSTHLTNFGSASLWPIYMYCGLLSQYVRSKLNSFAAYHLAYIPALPHFVDEVYRKTFDVAPSDEILRHLKRELMQAIWGLLLTPDFICAYLKGIVIYCSDKIKRRVFPRFFVYSADYPEKMLILCLKHLGKCLCPECLIETSQVPDLGMLRDIARRKNVRVDTKSLRDLLEKARRKIYQEGRAVEGPVVEGMLSPISLTATRNAFSNALHEQNFNFYSLAANDFLHEIEIGTWKAIFLHLIRILYAIGAYVVNILNERYRNVPSFGKSAIRQFTNNVSSMKKPAARDFEDLLICAMPCFEGLTPEPHNTVILDLLFTMALWHGFAKMRIHTDTTVNILRGITTELGRLLRKFQRNTCAEYETTETPEEHEKRLRQVATKIKKGGQTEPVDRMGKRRWGVTKKEFKLTTYKFHAMGHYADNIVRLGSTLSYSTQAGESEHRRVKRLYPRTNKKDHAGQIANHITRQENIRMVEERWALKEEPLPEVNYDERYQIAAGTTNPEVLPIWLRSHAGDPSIKNFLPKLQDHIRHRLTGSSIEDFSNEERDYVQIMRHSIYFHGTLRINYTTYDMRREQDLINVNRNRDIMVLAQGDKLHPYWYGHVIGIFHLNARLRDTGSTPLSSANFQRLDVLWVRWYGLDDKYKHGFAAKRLARVGFGSSLDDTTFGFLDPARVLRAAHLIPAFTLGQSSKYLPSNSLAYNSSGNVDYLRYYVNIFADRDMLSRYSGTGVGHVSMRDRLQDLRHSITQAFSKKTMPSTSEASKKGTRRSARNAVTSILDYDSDEEDSDRVEESGLVRDQEQAINRILALEEKAEEIEDDDVMSNGLEENRGETDEAGMLSDWSYNSGGQAWGDGGQGGSDLGSEMQTWSDRAEGIQGPGLVEGQDEDDIEDLYW